MINVISSSSKIGCSTRSNSLAGIVLSLASMFSQRPRALSAYPCMGCTCSSSRAAIRRAIVALTSRTISGSTPPSTWTSSLLAVSRAKVSVYSDSTRLNSSDFSPCSMLPHIFSDVRTFELRNSANSPETSFCRAGNRPWNRKGPNCTGSTGSKMHFRASQLVRYPTTVPPAVSVHGLS